MGGVTVFELIGGGFVDFDQNKAGGVVALLHHIETQHPRFAHAIVGVIERGIFERLNLFGFYMNVDMDNVHTLRVNRNRQLCYAVIG